MLIASIFLMIPLILFFSTLSLRDYKEIIALSLLIDTSVLSQLPSIKIKISLLEFVVNIFILQMILLGILLLILFIIAIFRRILAKILNHPLTYVGAYFSLLLRKFVYFIYSLPAMITGKLRPYMFYTKTTIKSRDLKSILLKGFWMTLVIFAVSFQFAGLFYSKTNKYPVFLGHKFTIIDASVVFMILTGTFWLIFLIGVDLLDRFDISLLDLNTSRLTNIGDFFSRLSKKALNFLSLSFIFIAIQGFQSSDWIQPIIFIDIFNLFAFWMLLSYESKLERVGAQVRQGLDRRSLTGAERIIITKEKKHFGKKKLREAEELMRKSELRLKMANEVGLSRSLIESFLLLWIVPALTLSIAFIQFRLNPQTNYNRIISLEIIISILVLLSMLVLHGYLSQYDIIRSELIWFPMLFVGNAIANYVDYNYDFYEENIHNGLLLLFSFLWFVLVVKNIYPRMPGNEFWKIYDRLLFFMVIMIFWIITVFFQIYLNTNFALGN